MILLLTKPATREDIKKAREEYKSYIKITVDINTDLVVIGGEYHFDAEQQLLMQGSKQENIWGGGLDLSTGLIRTNALINMRPGENNSMEILDQKVKEKYVKIVLKYMHGFIKEE